MTQNTHLPATESIDKLNPNNWHRISVEHRLNILYQIRGNLAKYADELATSDSNMKNTILGEDLYSHSFSKIATVFPVATTVSACIDLYKSYLNGKHLSAINTNKIDDDIYDIHVFPNTLKDRIVYLGRKDILRVNGKPTQTNFYDKESKIIAILGAGNYSSSLEIIKAIFLENAVVVHKPHPLNFETDKIWAKVLEPLVRENILSFCIPEDGQKLTQDTRISKIYFTGGANTAKAIKQSTDAELISECGGNNPCIIVPGVWTAREIKHQAIQIVTVAKLNGGAICGRPQTIITSKHWEQRTEFLNAIRDAIADYTPSTGTYYPNSENVKAEFSEHNPNAEIIKPENGIHRASDFMFITDINKDDFCTTTEAFCQIMNEVPLDISTDVDSFLENAVKFCNTKLHGTLTSCILVDKATQKANAKAINKAVINLKYGSVTVNIMSVFTFFNPYLTWGGNEDKDNTISGYGHFGNLLNYENIEKSIIFDKFVSPAHMLNTNKKYMDKLYEAMTNYSINPSCINLIKLLTTKLICLVVKKDF